MIQLDSINVIYRSHYTVLFSRLGYFDKNLLDEMLYPDKLLMEQWAHVASIVPSEDYLFFNSLHKHRQKVPLTERKNKKLNYNSDKIFKYILNKIKKEKELSSKELKFLNNKDSEKWWSKKPERYAMDLLFRMGKLLVKYRKNFVPYYDLSERVLGSNFLFDGGNTIPS